MRMFGAVLFFLGVGAIIAAAVILTSVLGAGGGLISLADRMNTYPVFAVALVASAAGLPVAGAVLAGAGAIMDALAAEGDKTRAALESLAQADK